MTALAMSHREVADETLKSTSNYARMDVAWEQLKRGKCERWMFGTIELAAIPHVSVSIPMPGFPTTSLAS
jgi:hypothetical protein